MEERSVERSLATIQLLMAMPTDAMAIADRWNALMATAKTYPDNAEVQAIVERGEELAPLIELQAMRAAEHLTRLNREHEQTGTVDYEDFANHGEEILAGISATYIAATAYLDEVEELLTSIEDEG